MTRIRKPNRVSRPVRVTERATLTTYPWPNYAAMDRLRSRWSMDAARELIDPGMRQDEAVALIERLTEPG